VLPLQVMLEAMRQHYADGNLDRAAGLAKDAAPYCHPRLAPKEIQSQEEVDVVAFIETELGLAKKELCGQEAPPVQAAPAPGGTGPPERPGEVHPRSAATGDAVETNGHLPIADAAPLQGHGQGVPLGRSE